MSQKRAISNLDLSSRTGATCDWRKAVWGRTVQGVCTTPMIGTSPRNRAIFTVNCGAAGTGAKVITSGQKLPDT